MKYSFKLDSLSFNGIEIKGISSEVEGTPKEVAKTFSILTEMATDLAQEQADLLSRMRPTSSEHERPSLKGIPPVKVN